jgi:hypothetical protein
MTEVATLAMKIAALQAMCDNTVAILFAVSEESKASGDYGLAVAASHLSDSLAAFSHECERSLLKDKK